MNNKYLVWSCWLCFQWLLPAAAEKPILMDHDSQVEAARMAPQFNLIRQKIREQDASALDALKALPVRDAELVLAAYMHHPSSTDPHVVFAKSLAVQIPGIWDYYATLIKENIEQRHGIFIGDIFNTIAGINTDDSIKLIGPYLFSSVDPNPYLIKGRDFGFPTVSGAAVDALHKMDLPDSPTKGQRSLRGSEDDRAWQNW